MSTSVVADPFEALTKDDLKALRTADSVTFSHGSDGRHYVRGIRRLTVDGFETEVRREIRVPSNIRSYDSDRKRSYGHAFEMINSAQYDDDWKTVVSLLRTGDELALLWYAGNSNAYVSDANLRRDELRLIVNRGNRRLSFLIDVSVCADNTARMTQS